jgi:GxxExxY protein
MKQGLLSEKVIACAIEVRKELGFGFLERVYENALLVELARGGMRVDQQKPLQVKYRGAIVGDYFADLVVEERLLVEIKSIERTAPEHSAQVLNYLRATGLRVGLLLNFGPTRLGISRLVQDHDEDDPI